MNQHERINYYADAVLKKINNGIATTQSIIKVELTKTEYNSIINNLKAIKQITGVQNVKF